MIRGQLDPRDPRGFLAQLQIRVRLVKPETLGIQARRGKPAQRGQVVIQGPRAKLDIREIQALQALQVHRVKRV